MIFNMSFGLIYSVIFIYFNGLQQLTTVKSSQNFINHKPWMYTNEIILEFNKQSNLTHWYTYNKIADFKSMVIFIFN